MRIWSPSPPMSEYETFPGSSAAMLYTRGSTWCSVRSIGVEREFFIDNLLVRIHVIIEVTWWTGLAPWEFEFPYIYLRNRGLLMLSKLKTRDTCEGTHAPCTVTAVFILQDHGLRAVLGMGFMPTGVHRS